MKIAFYDTKPYDKIWFEQVSREYGYNIKFFEHHLSLDSAPLCAGYNAVCAFVGDDLSAPVIEALHKAHVGLIALRCAGYNNVDINAAKGKLKVVRVPGYSPAAVAEHAFALLLAVNRKTHRAFYRTRDNNFSINGLMGFNLRDKTAGVVGTGQIGKIWGEIAKGFGMRVLAYDTSPDPGTGFEYVTLDILFTRCDVISLHCPLTDETRHMVDGKRLSRMKESAVILNTSRGALIDTEALLGALLEGRIGGAGLDVYEEENGYFYEDKSSELMRDSDLTRLISLPNVLVTSHQAFFTREAMQAIAMATMENIYAFEHNKPLKNEVTAEG
ncbi:MAG: 2-hydroxyacid dehydrogenase [Oscillospiraceae bacterium]|nr:2-hydroxyacid dehydrogenase [Oscillospiraceae bacterium]